MLLAGLIQHLLGAEMTEAKVCAQRGSEARYSKDRESLRKNIAGDGVAFAGIPRAKGFGGARKLEHAKNTGTTEILFLLK